VLKDVVSNQKAIMHRIGHFTVIPGPPLYRGPGIPSFPERG